MNASIESARSHPAVVASLVAAALAVTACALVAIAYMLGWIPSKAVPVGPTSMAIPGQQVAGSGPDLALLPGETMVAAPDAGLANPTPPASAIPQPPKELAHAATSSVAKPSSENAAPAPEAAKRASEAVKPMLESKSAPAPRKPAPAVNAPPAPPIYAPTAPPPSSSATYAQVLPPRAAPSKPNYTRSEMEAPYTSYERSTRAVCVNCGVIASIRVADFDWEVRVRFDDGSAETLRYPDPPRMRVGDRVHLEDGRLVAD